jgi:sensor domain CHASE-containing protein
MNNYYYVILFLALIFFIISKYNSSILISLIIIIIFYYYIDNNIKQNIATKTNIEEEILNNIDKGIDTIKELNTNNFNININYGNIKFLKKIMNRLKG